ncbi:hypothetical protein M2G46_22240 [Vibrio vulnificus]|nr:hypothetical protein [Vibrio vulnificus]
MIFVVKVVCGNLI